MSRGLLNSIGQRVEIAWTINKARADDKYLYLDYICHMVKAGSFKAIDDEVRSVKVPIDEVFNWTSTNPPHYTAIPKGTKAGLVVPIYSGRRGIAAKDEHQCLYLFYHGPPTYREGDSIKNVGPNAYNIQSVCGPYGTRFIGLRMANYQETTKPTWSSVFYVLLLPFAIILDLVTAPFQLLFFLYQVYKHPEGLI